MAYTFGECTYGAALIATWLPSNLGNAATWVNDAAKDGLSISQSPVIGAAMVFSGSYPGSGGDGHVGIVQSIGSNGYPIIKEMNAGRNGGGFGVYDTYQTTAYDASFVEGYIMPPGSDSANTTTSANLLAASKSGFQWWNPGTWIAPPDANPVYGGTPGASNPVGTPGTGAWGVDLSGVLVFISKSGEVLIGVAVLIVGLYFVAKGAGAPSVTNVIGKVPGMGVVKGIAA